MTGQIGSGAHLVFGRTARVSGDVRAVAAQLKKSAPRLFGRDLGRRTVILPLAGRDEVVLGVSFAAALNEGMPFSSIDLQEERKRARGIDLEALVDSRGDIELHEHEGFMAVLSGAPAAYLYLVAGLQTHLPRPVGFEELRRGERFWVGKRVASLTPEAPVLWLDLLRRDAESTVLRTFHAESLVRDMITLHTLGALAQRAESHPA